MKKIFGLLAILSGSCLASNLDGVTENSVQFPISAKGDISSNWFMWSKDDINNFPDEINTFVITPTSHELKDVTYIGCDTAKSSSICEETTNQYIKRAWKQLAEIKKSNPNHRVYIGVPHAIESKQIPTTSQIRGFLKALSIWKGNSEPHNLYDITGLYVSDEEYHGSTSGITNNIHSDTTKVNREFQYLVNLRLIMNEYNQTYVTMPIMWLPKYASERAYMHLSKLLQWQKDYGLTIFNRINIQPGFYGRRAGVYSDDAVEDVFNWVSTQQISKVSVGNSATRIGAMVEASPSVDWCTERDDQIKSGNYFLAHGERTYRPQYVIQHSKFNDLVSENKDINFFLSQRSTEWDNHTLLWERDNGATAEKGNPYIMIDKFYDGIDLGYQSMNQRDAGACTFKQFNP